MAPNYKFNFVNEINCLFIRFTGEVTKTSLLDMMVETVNHQSYSPTINRVTDYRGITLGLSNQEIVTLGEEMTFKFGDVISLHKEAVIVDSMLIHGVFRRFISVSDWPITYRIFNQKHNSIAPQIRKFLSLPDDYVFPDLLQPLD